jgi:hypothetical protein
MFTKCETARLPTNTITHGQSETRQTLLFSFPDHWTLSSQDCTREREEEEQYKALNFNLPSGQKECVTRSPLDLSTPCLRYTTNHSKCLSIHLGLTNNRVFSSMGTTLDRILET